MEEESAPKERMTVGEWFGEYPGVGLMIAPTSIILVCLICFARQGTISWTDFSAIMTIPLGIMGWYYIKDKYNLG